MPANSEAQRRLMAAARAYKRGTYKGKASAKVKELARSMSDKDLSDFMKKESAPRGEYLRKMLDQLGTQRISGINKKVLQYLGLGDIPKADMITSAISGKARHHMGKPTSTAKATFAKAGKRPQAIADNIVPPEFVDSTSEGLASLAKTLRRKMKSGT